MRNVMDRFSVGNVFSLVCSYESYLRIIGHIL